MDHQVLLNTAASLLSMDSDGDLDEFEDFSETMREFERETRDCQSDDGLSISPIVVPSSSHRQRRRRRDGSGAGQLSASPIAKMRNRNHRSNINDGQSNATLAALKLMQSKVAELQSTNKRMSATHIEQIRTLTDERDSAKDKYEKTKDRLKTLIEVSTQLRDKLKREQRRRRKSEDQSRKTQAELTRIRSDDSIKLSPLKSEVGSLRNAVKQSEMNASILKEMEFERETTQDQIEQLREDLRHERLLKKALTKRVGKVCLVSVAFKYECVRLLVDSV